MIFLLSVHTFSARQCETHGKSFALNFLTSVAPVGRLGAMASWSAQRYAQGGRPWVVSLGRASEAPRVAVQHRSVDRAFVVPFFGCLEFSWSQAKV